MTTGPTTARDSPDWLIRPFEASRLAPAWLGLGVAIAWTLVLGLVHMVADARLGPMEDPFGWTVVVDGAFVGVLLAGHAHLHLRAVSDLHELAPILPGGPTELARLSYDVPNLSTPIRWLATILGAAGGVHIALHDATHTERYSHFAQSDPRYIAFVVQNVIFGAVSSRLGAAEIHMTRAYARLGERVEVDLLDLSKLRVFARKGLRSVLVWVLVSSTLSLFWVIGSAGQANVGMVFLMLGLVLLALVAPTLGVHRSIATAKAAELAVLAGAIRSERASTLAPMRADAPENARLGNLIAYQAFVRSIREWPFDLSIVSRSTLLILLGAGSWLGGALVERLLDLLLD